MRKNKKKMPSRRYDAGGNLMDTTLAFTGAGVGAYKLADHNDYSAVQ